MPEPLPSLTVADCARYAGLSVNTIRRRIACGDLPAHRIGPRVVRVRRTDLDAFLAGTPVAAVAR